MRIGKKNVLSINPLDYNIGLIGEGGIGKTSTIKEFVEYCLSDLDDPAEGYLFLEAGKEDGGNTISNLQAVCVPKWTGAYDEVANAVGFKTLVDDIIENKDEGYPQLKTVIVDTYDELRKISEKEVVRLHNIEHSDKRVKTIKAAFGGFMAGDDMADDMVLDELWKLKQVGVHFIIIGHTKMKTNEDGITDEKYIQLTTDMPLRSFNKIKNKLDILGVAYKDRTFADTGKKDSKQRKIEKIASETRRINFRDDDYSIDSKSRFAEIEPDIELSGKVLYETIVDAIQKEINKDGKTKEQRDKDQKAKQEAIKQSETKAKKEAKENKIDEEKNQKIVDEIMTAFSGFSDEEKEAKKPILKKVKEEYEFNTFKDLVSDYPTAKVLEIKNLVLA